MVTIRIPAPPRGLLSNLLGVLGLVSVTLAVGGLTHNGWWSALLGGAFAVGLSYVAQLNAAARSAEVPVAAPAQLRAAPAAARAG